MEKETKKNNWWKSNALTLILIVACVGYIGFMWFHLGQQGISKDIGQWNSLGGAIGGVIGTLLSGYVAILVHRTYQLQKEEIKSLRASAEEQNFQGMFEILLAGLSQIRENIILINNNGQTIRNAEAVSFIVNKLYYTSIMDFQNIYLNENRFKFQIIEMYMIYNTTENEIHKRNQVLSKLINNNLQELQIINKLQDIDKFKLRELHNLLSQLYYTYEKIITSKNQYIELYKSTLTATLGTELRYIIKVMCLSSIQWRTSTTNRLEDTMIFKSGILTIDDDYYGAYYITQNLFNS